MEIQTIKLSEDACPIAWIIEHQKEVAGYGFRISDEMKNKLLSKSNSGSLSMKSDLCYIYIPADPQTEGSKPTGVTLIKHRNGNENVCQWDVANIESVVIERIPGIGNILFSQKPTRGVILFTSPSQPLSKNDQGAGRT